MFGLSKIVFFKILNKSTKEIFNDENDEINRIIFVGSIIVNFIFTQGYEILIKNV